MSDRYKNLIAFQIIKSLNKGKRCMDYIAKFMQLTHPSLPTVPVLSDVTSSIENANLIIDREISDKISNFLEVYPQKDYIDDGLKTFSETLIKADSDKSKMITATGLNRAVLVSAVDLNDLLPIGIDIANLTYDVKHIADINDDMPYDWRLINSYQLLLNAISIELQGKNIYTGDILYPTFDQKVSQLRDRFIAAKSMWGNIPQTEETLTWKSGLDGIMADYNNATQTNELTLIGQYLEGVIDQLPNIWKHWYWR